MQPITDEFMKEMMGKTKVYTIVILHKTAKMSEPDAMQTVWEHGRRNFELRSAGKLAIVCPVRDESDIAGLGIFALNLEETKEVMEEDPGVMKGFFTYETHSCKSFPGDNLPE